MIKGLFFAQLPHTNQEDILSDCILKVADSIGRRGIKEGSDFTAYLFFSYKNTLYTNNKKKGRSFTDIDEVSPCSFSLDEELREEELISRLQEELLTEEIFDYVDANYPPLQAGFFNYYHKTKLSYKEIAEATGYSLSYIWKINSKIMRELKQVYNVTD